MRMGCERHARVVLPPGKNPGAHCTGDWVGPRASLDGCGEEKIFWPPPPPWIKPRIVSPWRVAIWTMLSLPPKLIWVKETKVLFLVWSTHVAILKFIPCDFVVLTDPVFVCVDCNVTQNWLSRIFVIRMQISYIILWRSSYTMYETPCREG